MKSLTLVLLMSILSVFCHAQKVTGVIKDISNGELLFAATIIEKGTTNGTTSDINGRFELNLDLSSPKVLVINYLGYANKEVTVSSSQKYIEIKLEQNAVTGKEIEVSASRISKKLQESPVTVERLGVQQIKETPAASFYDGLANLKGVDFTSASLAFKVINTRGFNSTAPVRTLQVIDGMDNQAPALNFSLGNFVGASEIDVEMVDIVVGANSATYGPNAFNGVIDINTKDPFKYPGINVQLKGANQNLFEGSIRYAKVIGEKFAFKINGTYLRADDWIADNFEPTPESQLLANTINGYDAVNAYGDEIYTTIDQIFLPELQDSIVYIYRDGYKEIDLADYDTRNLKLNGTLYYKLTNNVTASYFYNFGTGTTVYQGENRISINNIKFQQHKLEVKKENHFFIRAYTTIEDAGDSYDVVFTANQLLTEAKPLERWNNDFLLNIRPYINGTGNFSGNPHPRPQEGGSNVGTDDPRYHAWLNTLISDLKNYADTATIGGYEARYEPGTQRFDDKFQEIIGNPSFTSGGTRFQDQSSLKHVEGQYNFHMAEWNSDLPDNFRVGSSYRKYDPQSFGTIFSDTLFTDPNNPRVGEFKQIDVYEYGFYINTDKYFFDENLKLIASARLDFHKNFPMAFSPAASAIIKVSNSDNIRVSFNSAIRNPTLLDQFQYYDLGRAILLGNIDGINLIPLDDFVNEFIAKGTNPSDLEIYIDPIQQEKVKTAEIGYKGIVFSKLYVDASYYRSWYTDFIGNFLGVVNPNRNNNAFPFEVRRVPKNSNALVITHGASIGLSYYFKQKYSITGNYTYTELIETDKEDPLIPSYNTPKNKFNVGIGGSKIKNKYGFNFAYKFVEGFLFEGSPQFTGPISSYGLFDAQVNYKWIATNVTFKLGMSNLLNNRHFEVYGGPTIGRLTYLSLNYEL